MVVFWNRREHSNSELVLKQTGTQQQSACSQTCLLHCGKWSPHLLQAYRWNLADVKTMRITPGLVVTRSVHARKLTSSLRSSAARFQRFCCRHNYVKSNISIYISFFLSFFLSLDLFLRTHSRCRGLLHLVTLNDLHRIGRIPLDEGRQRLLPDNTWPLRDSNS